MSGQENLGKNTRGPYRDLAFIKKYMIQCKTDEIESIEGVIQKLCSEYDVSLIKKHAVGKELLKVVEEKTKELQQCQEECEEKEREIQAFLQEKIAANQATRDKAEKDLMDRRQILEEILESVEQRTKELEYRQEYVDEGQNKLDLEIKTLMTKIEKAEKDFKEDRDFINKLWEGYRSFYVKNESENLNALKAKYLDAGIDGLSQKQSFVIQEKFRLKWEIKQQARKMEEQKNEYEQQEHTAEMYRIHLDRLRNKLYNIVPIPEWTLRVKSTASDVEYITHEEPNLCPHEYPFKVPLNVKTTWVNYKNPEGEKKKSSSLESSLVVNDEDASDGAPSTWTFDRRRVIRYAHGS